MKILLVRPPVPRHTIGLKHIMICEPLELEYVAAGLRGHAVQVLDLIVETGLRRRLETFQPDIVGTSSYIAGVNEVIKVCRQAKHWNPACLTVVGGVQAAQVAEDFADNAVDLIVKGDGPTTIAALVRALQHGADLRSVPGIAIPQDRHTLFHSAAAPYMPPPDELPLPDRSVVSHLKHRYYYLMHRPVATMKTAWGCWYRCSFCYTWRITGGTPYARSPRSVVDELKTIEAEEVYIVDDIFLINPVRLGKIAELIRREGIRKNYLVYARADFIAANEPIIAEWAALGLKAVFVGIDAITDRQLELMNKETRADQNLAAIRVLQRHGVDIYGSLIPQPDYTVEDWKRMRAFIRDAGLYYVNISPLVPLPATAEYEAYKDRLIVPREAHGLWDLSHAVVKPRLSLREHYCQLLITYASVIFNLRRARRVTQRTLPSVWSWNYARLLWGAAKIGWQFLRAASHHSPRQLRIACDRGPEVDLPYAYERLFQGRRPDARLSAHVGVERSIAASSGNRPRTRRRETQGDTVLRRGSEPATPGP